jgi:hypothetical protein
MLQFILECIAFQLVFLVIYDFFLKRETFFQWNRVYLIGTYILSLVLPWIKIEALRTSVPEQYHAYPEYLWGANNAAVEASVQNPAFQISWQDVLFFGGMFLAALLFGYKILQLYRLRRKGKVNHYQDFTKIHFSWGQGGGKRTQKYYHARAGAHSPAALVRPALFRADAYCRVVKSLGLRLPEPNIGATRIHRRRAGRKIEQRGAI